MDPLKEKITTTKGIGPKKATLFNKLGITCYEDALAVYPRDYVLVRGIQPVSEITLTEDVSLLIRFYGTPKVNRVKRGLTVISITASDESGKVECLWFNQPYRRTLTHSDKLYYVRGKAELKNKKIQLVNPIVEEYNPISHDNDYLMPIYPLTEGLTQRDLRQLMQEALKRFSKSAVVDLVDEVALKNGLIDYKSAMLGIHSPKNSKDAHLGRERLIFDEFFSMQVALQSIKRGIAHGKKGLLFEWDNGEIDKMIENLSFQLTASQRKVLDEVLGDLRGGSVMNRLIQGDVGSGKTIIAAIALYTAVISGYQGALMVPTEVLARQHYASFNELFSNMDINVALLTGSLPGSSKRSIKEELIGGDIDIVIGTHAVITEDVFFRNLGLVVTDEQHRFGVRQRATLQNKGERPHALIMSATPIPRTMTHFLYGDLDLSIIDELPPGRIPISTYHVASDKRQRAYNYVKAQVKEGRQAYIICPLVEVSEKISLSSATEVYEELANGYLRDQKMGLLHGRMDSKHKQIVMDDFAEGRIKILVATTVIEVGINVPNACVMVIENAERFGLAQLHQLRGRVGRGKHPSHCILLSDSKDRIALEKLKTMVKSNNGFEIAEKDLLLRGPGDLFGLRQHGLPSFKIANPLTDIVIFKKAQEAAFATILNYDHYFDLIKKSLEDFFENVGSTIMN